MKLRNHDAGKGDNPIRQDSEYFAEKPVSRRLVALVLYHYGPMDRTEIKFNTGLSKDVVGEALRDLGEDRMIEQTDWEGDGRVKLYRLNPEYFDLLESAEK